MAALAAVIKASISGQKSLDELNDQMITLNGKMDLLSEIIKDNNQHLSNLIVHNEFTANVVVEANTLEHLWRDVIMHKTTESIDKFVRQCDKQNPHVLVIKILNRLKYDSTNPLITAMEADILRSRKTFEIWRKTMHNLLGTLQMVDAFYEGLHNRTRTSEAMKDAITQAKTRLDEFIARYKANYWPHCVEQLMRETADNYQSYNDEHKAIHLQNKLSEIYTNDQFYVMVFDHSDGNNNHAFKGQAVYQFGRGGCSMVVSRSTTAAVRTEEQRMLMIRTVGQFAKPVHIISKENHGMHESLNTIYNAIPHRGFAGLIAMDQHPHFRWTGHSEPGRVVKCGRERKIFNKLTGSTVVVRSEVLFVAGFV